MRVPVYQQQVTPQIPSVRSQVQVPNGATGVAVKPIDTTAGITQGVESLRLGLMKMNENREKFMLASAVNEYRRSNTEFLHAKDTGLFAKKGKDVFGISQAYDEFSSKTMEDIAKRYKMSGVARDRFVEATSALYNASLSSVMQHEQRETDAAQQMEWKTMITDSLNAVALSPYDDAVCEENWKIMAGAIAQQFAPFGDQVVDSKVAEARSQYVITRLAPMIEDNPKAAGAFLKAHSNELTGDDRLKAQKAVDAKLDVIKVQEMTDDLVRRFRGREDLAFKFVHKNMEGDMENKMIASLKSRYAEEKIRVQSAATSLASRQNALAKAYKQAADAGQFVTKNQLEKSGMRPDQIVSVQRKMAQNFVKLLENKIEAGEPVDPMAYAEAVHEKFGLDIGMKQVNTLINKVQARNAKDIDERIIMGERFSPEEIDVQAISTKDKARFKAIYTEQSSLDGAMKEVDKLMGGRLYDLSPEDRYKNVRRYIGISDKEHDAWLIDTWEGLVTGKLPISEAKLRAKRGRISEMEADDMIQRIQSRDKDSEAFEAGQLHLLNSTSTAIKKKVPGFDDTPYKAKFREATDPKVLPYSDSDRRKKVQELTRSLRGQEMIDAGLQLDGRVFGRSSDGKQYDEIMAEDFTGTQEYTMREPESVSKARGKKPSPAGGRAINGKSIDDVMFGDKK